MGQNSLNLQQHPAHFALEKAIDLTNGALDLNHVHVAACIYDSPLRAKDPGEFLSLDWYGHSATTPLYPASVVKTFFLNALAQFRETGLLEDDPEDDRAAHQMMAISSNEATVYLVGRLTDAYDGSPLYGEKLEEWCRKRHRVQEWYDAQEKPQYRDISLLHGTYHDSPYGRAKQIRTEENGNKLTALSSAALMHDIARGALPRSEWMLQLMEREFQRGQKNLDPDGDQVTGFLTEGLPQNVTIWSKAGHTSWTRHDLVYGERQDGKSFILSVMCDGTWSAQDKSFLPNFAKYFYQHAFES